MSFLARTLFSLSLCAAIVFPTTGWAGVLYDAAIGTNPSNQDWVLLATPLFGAQFTETMQTGQVLLDSTADTSVKVGYFSLGHSDIPFMNRQNGYRVRFDVQVLSESHNSQNRAGFSVIILSDDSVGVEIAFWENEIWAQTDTPLFTHGEGVAFDTTAAIEQYDLFIVDDRYALWAAGVPILSGPLRDYSAHSNPVYIQEEFMFFGDDTSSANAQLALAYIEAEDNRPPLLLGDMNGDQQITEADINPFVLALSNPDDYFAFYPLVDADDFGDMNQDGNFNLGDVALFKAMFGSSSAANEAFATVPEPASSLLLFSIVPALFLSRRKKHLEQITHECSAKTIVSI